VRINFIKVHIAYELRYLHALARNTEYNGGTNRALKVETRLGQNVSTAEVSTRQSNP
jgi:hypothetical protein